MKTHKMIADMAREFAGVFYDQDRSTRFRLTWPNQDEYVDAKWPHFVDPARQVMAQMLGDAAVPEAEKVKIHEAIIADRFASVMASPAAKDVIQLAPGTLQYHGDRFENRETAKTLADKDGNFQRRLMGSAARFKF